MHKTRKTTLALAALTLGAATVVTTMAPASADVGIWTNPGHTNRR